MLTFFDLVIGMDVINKMGGVTVRDSMVKFSETYNPPAVQQSQSKMCKSASDSIERLEIDDVEFHAYFNGDKWIIRWKWNSNESLGEPSTCLQDESFC